MGICDSMFLLPALQSLGHKECHLLRIASCFAAVQSFGYLLLRRWPEKRLVFVGAILQLFSSMWGPALTALITQLRPQDIGLTIGFFRALNEATSVFAPLSFSWLFASLGPLSPFTTAGCCYVLTMAMSMHEVSRL